MSTSQLMQIRRVSRQIAVASAGLALGALVLASRAGAIDAIGGDPFVVGIVTQRAAPAAAAPPRPAVRTELAALSLPDPSTTATGAEGGGVRLWWDGPRGEIVFRSAQRFDLCTEARAAGRSDPDCPDARDRRAMVLAPTLDG